MTFLLHICVSTIVPLVVVIKIDIEFLGKMLHVHTEFFRFCLSNKFDFGSYDLNS